MEPKAEPAPRKKDKRKHKDAREKKKKKAKIQWHKSINQRQALLAKLDALFGPSPLPSLALAVEPASPPPFTVMTSASLSTTHWARGGGGGEESSIVASESSIVVVRALSEFKPMQWNPRPGCTTSQNFKKGGDRGKCGIYGGIPLCLYLGCPTPQKFKEGGDRGKCGVRPAPPVQATHLTFV